MKITISGHGGHLCQADSCEISNFEYGSTVGATIEEAIGRLVRFHAQDFGIIIEIFPCETIGTIVRESPPISRVRVTGVPDDPILDV